MFHHIELSMAKRTKTLGVALVTLGAFDAAMGFNSAFSASLHRQLQQHQQSHQHQHQHQHHQPQHRHQWVSAPRTVLEAKPYILGLAENQEESDARGEADFEEALGVLVFSSVDPMLDIARNQEMYDEVFVEWVSKKADKCEDLDEREALKSLAVMVTETREKLFAVMDAQTAEEAQAVMAGTAGEEGNSNNPNLDTFGDVPMARLDAKGNAVVIGEDSPEAAQPVEKDDKAVLDAMRSMQFGATEMDEQKAAEAKAAEEAAKQAEADARKTYETLLGVLLTSEDLDATVKERYYECDYKFLETCENVKATAAESGDDEGVARVQAVIDSISKEAAAQIEAATAVLGKVLNAGGPGLMESEMAKLCKQGKVSSAVLELLEANIQAATAAGAAEPAAVMTKIRDRATLELDKLKDPEQRLMSQLIREESSEQRVALLTKAFTPVQSLLLGATGDDPSGEDNEPMPEVTPPKFIELTSSMIENFGNLDLTGDQEGLKVGRFVVKL